MSKQELNDCLKSFYTSARKQDGSYYKTSSMKSIRAAIDRFLRSPPHCKQFSIIGDPAFTEANQVLDAFVKDLRKTGKIAGVVHKKPITKQQIQRLYECGELGPANSTNPAQLQRTVWFYLVLYFGQRGRENQRQMKSNMHVFRKTPQGKEYCELNKEVAGSVLRCCGASVASEQQHKQDLRRIYKRENEFSKSSLFTRMLCGFLPECIAPSRVHCATYNTRL